MRELKSAIQYCVVHSHGNVIRPEDLPPEVTSGHIESTPLPTVADVERERILRALEECDENRTAAARLLGMSRATFYRHLSRLGLDM